MAVHWYILPFDALTRSPRHMEPPEPGMRWACVRYIHSGDDSEFVGIVKADLSDARHAEIQADAECVVLPNIDNTINLGAVTSFLAARNIPSGWVQAGMTYRQVLRIVCRMGLMWTRLRGTTLGAKVFTGGVTLATPLASLPANVRQTLSELADEYQVSKAGVTTVQDALLAWYRSPRIQGSQIVVLDEEL